MSRHHRQPQRMPMRRSEAREAAFIREQMDSLQTEDSTLTIRTELANSPDEEVIEEVFDDIDEVELEVDEDDDTEVVLKTPPARTRRPVYVLDTNLILSCVDVLFDPNDENWREPLDFSPNLDNALLVIPDTVREELGEFKIDGKGDPVRAMNARTALKRLARFFENSERSINEVLTLHETIPTGWKNQFIAILPLQPGFVKKLPIQPTDNDGYIAATALAAALTYDGVAINGKANIDLKKRRTTSSKFVSLLTNDNELRARAEQFAVRVSTYSFTEREPFTGCRELTVPPEMFEQFYYEEKLSREDFEYFMPNEPPLLANEYLIMTPDDDEWPNGYFTDQDPAKNVARFNKANQCLYPLRFVKYEGQTPPNVGIAIYYDAMNDDNIRIVFVTGKAGVGKTHQAIQHGIKCVDEGKYTKVYFITTQSAKNPLGSLPGKKEEKEAPLVAFVKDAIRSYLINTPEFKRKRAELREHGRSRKALVWNDEREDSRKDTRENRKPSRRRNRDAYDLNGYDFESDQGFTRAEDFEDDRSRKKGSKLFYPSKNDKDSKDGKDAPEKLTYNELLDKQVNYIYDRHFECIPYEQAIGRSLHDAVVIIDEIQRAKIADIETDLTRPAEDSLTIVCGDLNQLPKNDPEHRLWNALTYSQLCFMDEECAAHVNLTENMRGSVARTFTANRDKIRRLIGLS